MLNQHQIEALKAPFPPEVLSADTSRGIELTGIKGRRELRAVRSSSNG